MNKQARDKVFAKCGGRCAYCGCRLLSNFHVDHIVPRVAGGGDALSNLNPSCVKCNNWKHSMPLERFRHDISRQVDRARKYSRNFQMAEKFGLIKETGKLVVFYFEKIPKIEKAIDNILANMITEAR